MESCGNVRVQRGPSFGLGSLLLVTCLLASCLALGRIDPMFGMLAAMIAAPALMRTEEVLRGLRRQGCQPGNWRKLSVFGGSVLLVVSVSGTVVGIAVSIASVGGLIGAAFGSMLDLPWLPVLASAWGLVAGLPAGLIAAGAIAQSWRLSSASDRPTASTPA